MRPRWSVGVGIGLVAAGLIAAAYAQGESGSAPDTVATADDPSSSSRGAGTDDPDRPPQLTPSDADTSGTADDSAGAEDGVPDGDGGADLADGAAVARDGVLRVRLPRGLDEVLVADIGVLADVLEVSVSRSDTVGLLRSRAADGTVRDRLPDGFQIPVAVDAIDPAAAASTLAALGVDDALRTMVAELEPGQALLTEPGARARGLDVGGSIDLDGVVDLLVVGLMPDDDAGRSEIMVHRDHAASLGMRPGRSVTVRHAAAPGSPTEELITAIEALAPDQDSVRITDVVTRARARADTNAPEAGGSPLVLGLPELKSTFGEFAYRPRRGVREIDIDPSFVAENIVSARVPLLGNVRCHRAIVGDLTAALDEVVAVGLDSWVDPGRYGGCFHARRIGTDRARLSTHSWGAAVDINVDLSLPGLGPVPPEQVIEIFGRHGFRWGGDFTTPDHHHWEWVGARATERRDRESS